MPQLLETHGSSDVWCGRSWMGLSDRRCAAFEQALALKDATDADLPSVVSEFLEFFDETGVGLLRDEEEWIFRSVRPTPEVVLTALAEHIAISSLVQALVRDAQHGCVEVNMLHDLGELLASHLLREEEEVRPLATPTSDLRPAN